jgi:hypothetical protein
MAAPRLQGGVPDFNSAANFGWRTDERGLSPGLCLRENAKRRRRSLHSECGGSPLLQQGELDLEHPRTEGHGFSRAEYAS